MKYLRSWLFIMLAVLSSDFCDGAKILAIFSLPFKSHFTCNNAVTRTLRDAGHEVTVITSFPQLAALENYSRVIDTTMENSAFMGKISYDHYRNKKISEISCETSKLEEDLCNKMIRSKNYQDLLNSTETFDAIFVEIHLVHECLLPIAQKLQVPVIGVITHKALYYADSAINNPNHPADVPFELAVAWKFNNFYERLINAWNYIVIKFIKHLYVQPTLKKFSQDNHELLEPFSGFTEIKPAMIFYNSHHSILPRPMNPNAIEIGGIQVSPAKPLPENIQKFVDEARNGLILFTFGSIVKTSSLPPDTIAIFMSVFAKIPQRVIWKYEDEMDNVPENVMLMNWLPQRDILEHRNVKAFISHCGLGGVYEAVHTATPVVACPLGVDQPTNAAILEHLGVAVSLDIDLLSEEIVLGAINAIINDTKYFDNMQKLSKVFKDRPMTPEQTIVYWTEYIIRHKGAPNLKPPSSQLNWFQYFLLDIISVMVIVTICIVYFVNCCLKMLVLVLCRIVFTIKKNKVE